MTPTNTARRLAEGTSDESHPEGGADAPMLSVRRLNVLRAGYLLMGAGLAVTKWPSLFSRSEPWPLFEGVMTYMLVALGLFALLGLRYPVKMLPVLLIESAWKLLWLAGVALPLWSADRMDPATLAAAGEILWVVVFLAVIPWRHVVANYISKPGDPWRGGGAGRRRGAA